MRGDDAESSVWDEFLGALLDHFFPQELMEAKAEEFVNLKYGKMSVKKYAFKFQKLSRYSLESVSNMRS